MVTITRDKEEAAVTRAQVQAQERDAGMQAAAAKAMAADAQRDLDAALPALDAAVASLKNLSRCGVAQGDIATRLTAWLPDCWRISLPACLPVCLPACPPPARLKACPPPRPWHHPLFRPWSYHPLCFPNPQK